jgi:hypothetical protein
MDRLSYLDLTKCKMDDASWQELGQLSFVKFFLLDDTELTDEHLKLFKNLSPVALKLQRTKLTIQGVSTQWIR